jgi:hypothetical protein
MPRRSRFLPLLAVFLALHAMVMTTAPRAFAQGHGQDLVTRGRALFDDQQYEESIQTLSAALLRPNNTKAQKVEIYRLLALNYITINRKDEAESAVRGLLALQPEYALPASESPRFRDFFSEVRKRWDAEGRPGLVKESEIAAAPVAMQHVSPAQVQPRTQIDLTAKLSDPQSRVTGVKLYYRTGSSGVFNALDADVSGADVKVSIPPSAVKPPIVEYYLLGVDKGGLPIVSRGDAGAPLRVAVPEPAKGWILPVAIGGGVAVLAALGVVVGVVATHKSPTGPGAMPTSTVTVNIGQ